MTPEQSLALVQRTVNELTASKYRDSEKHLAFIYQSGFLQAVLAQAIQNDSSVYTLYKNALKQAHSKKRR